MEVKSKQRIQLWNGDEGIVLSTVASKANVRFDDGRRDWVAFDRIVSAVNTITPKEAKFSEAKQKLADRRKKAEARKVAPKKEAGHPKEHEGRYEVGDMLVPTEEAKENFQLHILDTADKNYIVERRPIEKDKKQDAKDQIYGIRYEIPISTLDKDSAWCKFAKKKTAETNMNPDKELLYSGQWRNVSMEKDDVYIIDLPEKGQMLDIPKDQGFEVREKQASVKTAALEWNDYATGSESSIVKAPCGATETSFKFVVHAPAMDESWNFQVFMPDVDETYAELEKVDGFDSMEAAKSGAEEWLANSLTASKVATLDVKRITATKKSVHISFGDFKAIYKKSGLIVTARDAKGKEVSAERFPLEMRKEIGNLIATVDIDALKKAMGAKKTAIANTYTPLRVTIEGGQAFDAWVRDGQYWNGWEMPEFEKAEADKVLQWINEGPRHPDEQESTYDEATDTYHIWIPGSDEFEDFTGADIETSDGTKHTYGIGSGGWVWDEAPEEVQQTEEGLLSSKKTAADEDNPEDTPDALGVMPEDDDEGGEVPYPEILSTLEEKLTDAFDDVSTEFEMYSTQGEEVPHEAVSGFMPFTDGGYQVFGFTSIDMLQGTGRSLPSAEAQKEIERVMNDAYEYAKDEFKKEYPNIVAEIGEDNIDYNTLSEKGYSAEAEQLSELERGYMESSVQLHITAYYYGPDNSRSDNAGKQSIYIKYAVNTDYEYHREKGDILVAEDEFAFDSLDDLNSKLDAFLAKAMSATASETAPEATPEATASRKKIASIKKKADKLGQWDFDNHDPIWKTEAGEDGKQKIVRC